MDFPQPSQEQQPNTISSAPIGISIGTSQSSLQPNQTNQLIHQLRAELKAHFDEEWTRREAALQKELESTRAARATLEAELRAVRQAGMYQPMET